MAKLVRDKIPEIMRSNGDEPIVRVVRGPELLNALENKFLEEHEEYLAATTPDAKLEELADVMEVVFALAVQLGASKEKLLEVWNKKRQERGSFIEGYYLEGCKKKPGH